MWESFFQVDVMTNSNQFSKSSSHRQINRYVWQGKRLNSYDLSVIDRERKSRYPIPLMIIVIFLFACWQSINYSKKLEHVYFFSLQQRLNFVESECVSLGSKTITVNIMYSRKHLRVTVKQIFLFNYHTLEHSDK